MLNETITSTNFKFPKQTNVYRGKVREVYTIDNDIMVMVATDRISAFDHILPKGIPFKGQVLNQVATMFLEATRDIVLVSRCALKWLFVVIWLVTLHGNMLWGKEFYVVWHFRKE